VLQTANRVQTALQERKGGRAAGKKKGAQGAGAASTPPQDKNIMMSSTALEATLQAVTGQCKEHVKAFVQFHLFPAAACAYDQRLILAIGKYAAENLNAEDDALLKAFYDAGFHLLKDRWWHIKTGGFDSIGALFPEDTARCLQPLSGSRQYLARLIAWARTVAEEDVVEDEAEEPQAPGDRAQMPREALYLWLMEMVFPCVMHLTRHKHRALAIATEVTAVQIGRNHTSANTVQDAACGAFAAMRGQEAIQVFSQHADVRLPCAGQYSHTYVVFISRLSLALRDRACC